jgi:hypothetical protein
LLLHWQLAQCVDQAPLFLAPRDPRPRGRHRRRDRRHAEVEPGVLALAGAQHAIRLVARVGRRVEIEPARAFPTIERSRS